jgi:hypothetical protein
VGFPRRADRKGIYSVESPSLLDISRSFLRSRKFSRFAQFLQFVPNSTLTSLKISRLTMGRTPVQQSSDLQILTAKTNALTNPASSINRESHIEKHEGDGKTLAMPHVS